MKSDIFSGSQSEFFSDISWKSPGWIYDALVLIHRINTTGWSVLNECFFSVGFLNTVV